MTNISNKCIVQPALEQAVNFDRQHIETVLRYMDEYPCSGQNREGAAIIRHLTGEITSKHVIEVTDEWINRIAVGMPDGAGGMLTKWGYRQFAHAVLVAAKADNVRPTDDDLWESTLRDRDAYHEWADKLADAIAKHFNVDIGEHSNMNLPWAKALEAIEGQVAPQATAEPLTDEHILAQWSVSEKTSLSRLDCILHFARALLATPPTSKATEPVTCPYCDGTGDVHDQTGEWRGTCTCVATSKADTGEAMIEALRIAALEGARAMQQKCFDIAKEYEAKICAIHYPTMIDRAVELGQRHLSATSSTIKAEPTGEQL